MKFKRSHILLISLISIFLLLSLGAASAASVDSSADLAISDIDDLDIDNDVNDADALSQSGNDFISDDPTPDGEGGEGGDINDDPLPVSDTTIESGDKNFTFGDDLSFDVIVSDNQSEIISNLVSNNFIVSYKNETAENFTVVNCTYNDSKIILDFDSNQTLAVGHYTIRIQFINSVIDGINYTESETNVTLNLNKTNTTINASDVNVTFGYDIIIPLVMKVESNKTLNFSEKNMEVYYLNGDGEKIKINFAKVDGGIKLLNLTNVGFYTLYINYTGNNNCNPSMSTANVNLTVTNTTIDASDVIVKIGNEIIIPLVIKMESNKTLYFNESDIVVYLNGDETEPINFTVTNGGIELLNLTGVGYYSIYVKYMGNTNCNPSENTTTLTILENNNIIISEGIDVDFQTHNVTIQITVTNNDDILDINSGDIVLVLDYYNGTEYRSVVITNDTFTFTVEESNYKINFVLDDVQFNDAKFTIIYKNGTLNVTNKTIVFIEKNTIVADNSIKVNNHTTDNVTIPFSVNHTTWIIAEINGENVTIENVTTLDLSENDIILVLFYDNGTDNITVDLTSADFNLTAGENGSYNISFNPKIQDILLDNITLDNLTVTIVYGNETINETKKTISLTRFIEAKIVPVNDTLDYQDGDFVFLLMDCFDNTPLTNTSISVGVRLNNFIIQQTFTSNETGYIIVPNNNYLYMGNFLPVGTYNLTFSSSEFISLDDQMEITINPVQVKIIASDLVDEYGKTINYIFQVVNAATNKPIQNAYVQFVINGTVVNATREGKTNLTGYYTSPNLTLSGGTYNLTLKSIDDSLICSAVKKTLTINPKAAVISASNRTIYFGSDYSAILKLTDKKTGKAVANAWVSFKVYTSSTKYTLFYGKTNSKGQVYLSTPLAVGKHKIVYQTVDTNYKASAITRYLTVKKASAKFTASKVSTYYNSGKIFKIKLTNTKTQKPIYGGKVNIKVFISKNKYYNLIGTTDGNGLVYLKVTYNPGTYKVVISSADKGYSAKALTSQIKVTKSPIKMAPTALKVKKGNYFKVKVTSTKSKKVLSGVKVKVKVYTGKKFKTYTIKTNKKGIASLKITQKVGKHKVVLSPAQTKLYSAKALTKTLTVTK